MAVDTEVLLVKLEARITDFEKKMALAEKRAATASRRIQDSLKGAGSGINKALGGIAAALSIRAVTNFVRSSVQAGGAIADLSRNIGITAEELQELQFAFTQAGASADDIQAGFRGMTKFLADVSRDGKQSVAILQQIGLTFDELKRLSPVEAFTKLIDAAGKIQNPLQRNAVLMQIFGRSAQQLGQLSEIGAGGINRLREEARRLGLVVDNQVIQKMDDADDAIARLDKAWTKAGISLSVALVPAIEGLAAAFSNPKFQSALKTTASVLSDIVQLIANNPQILAILGGALAGGRLAGPVGAAVGALAGAEVSGAGSNRVKNMLRAAGSGDPVQSIRERHFGPGGIGVIGGKFDSSIFDSAPEAGGMTEADLLAKHTRDLQAATDATEEYGVVGEAAAEKADKHADKIKDVTEQLAFENAQLQRSARDQAIYNALNQAGVDISSAAGRAIAAQAAANYDLAQAIDAAVERMDLFRDAARTALGTFISDLREGKSAMDALADAMDRVVDRLLDFAVEKVITGLLGPAGGLGGGLLTGRASGGSLSRNEPSIVGENGPEIFVPRTAGIVGHVRGGKDLVVETHYHNNAGVRVQETQSREDGKLRLDVMIDQVVAAKGQDPSSRISQMLTGRGARPATIRR